MVEERRDVLYCELGAWGAGEVRRSKNWGW